MTSFFSDCRNQLVIKGSTGNTKKKPQRTHKPKITKKKEKKPKLTTKKI